MAAYLHNNRKPVVRQDTRREFGATVRLAFFSITQYESAPNGQTGGSEKQVHTHRKFDAKSAMAGRLPCGVRQRECRKMNMSECRIKTIDG
jgi:hypothetical protein